MIKPWVWICRLLTYVRVEPKLVVVLESVAPPADPRRPLSKHQLPETGDSAYPDTPNGNHAFPSTRKITNSICRADGIGIM